MRGSLLLWRMWGRPGGLLLRLALRATRMLRALVLLVRAVHVVLRQRVLLWKRGVAWGRHVAPLCCVGTDCLHRLRIPLLFVLWLCRAWSFVIVLL